MSGSETKPDISQWDRYWEFGSLHSFSQVADGNYGGAIAGFWQGVFAALQDGDCIVDIATGNGAVPLLALQQADAAGISIVIEGVDLARIDPEHQVGDPAVRQALARVNFHSRTAAESLPFDDASVSLVCSQYGLEYSELEASVAEIGRVTKPGGRVALILHHCDSALLGSTRVELEQLTFVLDRSGLWPATRDVLRAMADSGGAKKNQKRIERKQQAVKRALEQIHQQADRSANPRMLLGPTNYIHEILALAGKKSWSALFDMLEESRQRLKANRQRLLDMSDAACSRTDIEDLVGLLEQQGFLNTKFQELHESDGALLGWQLRAHRGR